MTWSVLRFGDSLTWGWVPVREGFPTSRYPWEARSTGAVAGASGRGTR